MMLICGWYGMQYLLARLTPVKQRFLLSADKYCTISSLLSCIDKLTYVQNAFLQGSLMKLKKNRAGLWKLSELHLKIQNVLFLFIIAPV